MAGAEARIPAGLLLDLGEAVPSCHAAGTVRICKQTYRARLKVAKMEDGRVRYLCSSRIQKCNRKGASHNPDYPSSGINGLMKGERYPIDSDN